MTNQVITKQAISGQAMAKQALQINARLFGFILLYVSSIFLVINSSSSDASMDQAGSWTQKKYSIKGDWNITTSDNQTVIRFGDKFKTKKGPDLKVFLSPKSIGTVTGKNAADDAVLIAVLKSNKGAQEYVLPEGVDINDFESLLIHCEQYSVLWGGAAI